ncbi:MAG: CHAT domain-containing protein [Cytophagaceae bacterium]|jgi:CHAT domain-containing protein|nr:CHAT domain-containing protein [Cytophagaceae bacterium]
MSLFLTYQLSRSLPSGCWGLFFILGIVGLVSGQRVVPRMLLADSLLRSGKYEEARLNFVQIEQTAQSEKKYSEAIQAQLGQLHCYYWLGKQDEFTNLSARVKTVLEKSGTPSNWLRWNLLQGLSLQAAGKSEMAERAFYEALTLNQKVKSTADEALILNYLGVLNWNKGNHELALEQLNQCLRIRQSAKSEIKQEELAACYNDLGLVFSSLHKLNEAEEKFSAAKEVYEKLYGNAHPKVGLVYNNLASIARKRGNTSEALAQYQAGLTIWKTLYGDQHPTIAFVYASIGQLHQENGNAEDAIRFYDLAKQMYKKIFGDKHPEIASILNQEALLYAQQNDYKRSLQQVQEALIANSQTFQDPDLNKNPGIRSYYQSSLMLNSLLIKAQVLQSEYLNKTLKKKNLLLALECLYTCDTLINTIRQLRTNKADKLELSASAAHVYEEALRVCFLLAENSTNKRTYLEKAFMFSEKSKSAILQEAISDAEAKQFANIPDAYLQEEKSFTAAIAALEQKIAEKKSPELEMQWKQELFALNRTYDSFVRELEVKFPEYYSLKYDVKSATVQDIQALLAPTEALLSYSISDSTHTLYVFYLDHKKFEAYERPITMDIVRELKGFRNAIKFDHKELLARISFDLYRQLFRISIPARIQQLTIIPEARLSTLPYEALMTKRMKGEYRFSEAPFLVKKYSVAIQYSASLMNSMRRKPSKPGNGIYLCAPINFSKYGINNLPGSKAEVDSIERMLLKSGEHCFSFTFDKATEWNVKRKIPADTKWIHFATHGIVNEDKPELSQIYLSADTSGGQDGHLYSGEIYNLQLAADLVTLSACQTGLGKVAKGEGLIGLSRALLYAGARNLVLSLWSVSDESTSALMIHFYTQLVKSKGTYRQALRQSKLMLLSDEKFARPYCWAPFMLVGN